MANPGRSTIYFGLTGGIACGKSTVAQILAECGARVIDADRLGHEMLQPASAAYGELLQRFGPGILAEDSGRPPTGPVQPEGEPATQPGYAIDRRKLGAIVFANPADLQALNAIVHPHIIRRVEEEAASFEANDPDAVIVVDAALIFESGIGGRCRKVIVAWCGAEQQIERVMAKWRLSRASAEARIAAQMPLEEKRRRADYVIDCSGALQQTRSQAEALYEQLRRLVHEEVNSTDGSRSGAVAPPAPARVKL
jgi:dephospho-CoA kinase